MQRRLWLWLVLGLVAVPGVIGCDIDSDDDDTRSDASAGRDGAVGGSGGSGASDGAVTRDSGRDDDDARVDETDDEDAGPGRPQIACDEDNGGISLPSSFCAVVFADELGRARHLTVTPSGDVYVAIANAPDGSSKGQIVALRDSDGDQRADRIERFGDDGGNGIVWRGGQLYFAPDDRVLRYALADGVLVPTGNPDTIVSGLPIEGDHKAKTIVLEGDDLYVNIGSATNSCQQNNRALESPGIDPCPELDTRAGVWRFNADAVDQEQVDGARFVRGGRNLTALALHTSGVLYAVQNGRDQLYENWPMLYSPLDDERTPSEELFRLDEGADYGWPYCYHDEILGRKVLAPEYGGDAVMAGRCADVEEPLSVLPAHWAPARHGLLRCDAVPGALPWRRLHRESWFALRAAGAGRRRARLQRSLPTVPQRRADWTVRVRRERLRWRRSSVARGCGTPPGRRRCRPGRVALHQR